MAHIETIWAIPELPKKGKLMMDKIEYLLMLAEDNRADNSQWSAEVHKIGLTRYRRQKAYLMLAALPQRTPNGQACSLRAGDGDARFCFS